MIGLLYVGFSLLLIWSKIQRELGERQKKKKKKKKKKNTEERREEERDNFLFRFAV